MTPPPPPSKEVSPTDSDRQLFIDNNAGGGATPTRLPYRSRVNSILTGYEPVPDRHVGVRRQAIASVVHLLWALVRMDVVIETGAEQADVEKVHLGVGARP